MSDADGESIEWSGDGLFDIRVRQFGLPIGNIISQILSNVYLSPPDHVVKDELRVKGYVRCMDDCLLFDDDRSRLRSGRGLTRGRRRSSIGVPPTSHANKRHASWPCWLELRPRSADLRIGTCADQTYRGRRVSLT